MKRFTRVLALLAFLFAIGALSAVDLTDRTLPPAVAGLVLTQDAAAQNGGGGGLTCGWCVYGAVRDWDPEIGDWVFLYMGHSFLPWGDGCGWIGNGGGNGGSHLAGEYECSRCGGTSFCHTEPDPGPCHIECGPGGGELLAAAIADLQDAIDHRDVSGIVRVVHATSLLEFSAREGAIIAAGACHDPDGSAVFPVPASLIEPLSAAVRQAQ